MKKKIIKRLRGRKANGALKEVEPDGSILKNAEKLAFGQAADDPVSKMVRAWFWIRLKRQELEKQRRKFTDERIEAAKTAPTSDDSLQGNTTVRDSKAIQYCEEVANLEDLQKSEVKKLTWLASCFLELPNASWFRKVADAIDAEITADGQDKHPLQSALLLLFGRPNYKTNEDGLKCLRTDSPLDKAPRYTINDACKILESHGIRPNPEEFNWKRTVRRACKEVGIVLLKSKSGPKRKKNQTG